MYNLDYITTQTKEQIVESLKYDFNKYNSLNLKQLLFLYEDDKEVVELIAQNSNTDFVELMIITSKNEESYFEKLLNNDNIFRHIYIIKYINEETKNDLNKHLSNRLLNFLEI